MPPGGKRAGAGRPKGTTGIKHKSTLSKEQAREAVRVIVQKHLAELLAAQLAHAKGLKYLVTRDKHTGKFVKVTESMLKAFGETPGEDVEIIEVWEKDPSVQAFTDLMNRALDKPKEQEQDVNVNLQLEAELVRRLAAARKRVKG